MSWPTRGCATCASSTQVSRCHTNRILTHPRVSFCLVMHSAIRPLSTQENTDSTCGARTRHTDGKPFECKVAAIFQLGGGHPMSDKHAPSMQCRHGHLQLGQHLHHHPGCGDCQHAVSSYAP